MADIPLAEQVNREPANDEPPPQFPLSAEQLYRLETIASHMMRPVLEQTPQDLHLGLEAAAHLAVELAFHVMNKARDCRIIESRIDWRTNV